MKRLYLLVTGQYPREYEKDGYWSEEEVMKLPVVNSLDYDEIVLCGGEPTMVRGETRNLADSIKTVLNAMGKTNVKLYLHTHSCDYTDSDDIMRHCDGMIVKPLNADSMRYFRQLNKHFLDTQYRGKKDLRLSVKPELRGFLPENLKLWSMVDEESEKDIEKFSFRIAEPFNRVCFKW